MRRIYSGDPKISAEIAKIVLPKRKKLSKPLPERVRAMLKPEFGDVTVQEDDDNENGIHDDPEVVTLDDDDTEIITFDYGDHDYATVRMIDFSDHSYAAPTN